MSHRNILVSSALAAGFALIGAHAAAQSVVTGGATEPIAMYQSLMPVDGVHFSYAGTGSSIGKIAVFNNDGALFGHAGRSVPMSASELIITPAEDAAYALAHITSPATPADMWGPVLQMPAYVSAVAIPFNKTNTSGNPEALNFRALASSTLPDVADLCGIFSGRIVDWSMIPGSHRSGPVTVLYRADGSGTSVLLGNFLNAACTATEPNLTGGAFDANQPIFAAQFPAAIVPGNFVPVSGSGNMDAAVLANVGGIGYVNPGALTPWAADASRVAQVKGFSPTEASISLAANGVPLPSGVAVNTRAGWMPNFGNPSVGYPIAGFSSLVVSQCFLGADPMATVSTMMEFLNGFYSLGSLSGPEVVLPMPWRNAVVATFLNNSSGRGKNVQNPLVCNGMGKPLP
ncbi:substrate-binding domain-containing protein [Bordetella genomosp. 13]|uniref:substrate-binding domain-containing protein n=1 Tax=Bordetella genomosp. 13 TaxID=463040 RepID=UPI00119E1ACA|nr:substrate-binding domain-containing protein [Bordetella genomosp. 13]